MVVFLVQALILVYALMRAINYWHGNYRDLREDRWGYACAELRQAYHSMDYAPLWRRIVLWPYRYYRISTLRAEVRGPGDHPSHCLPRSTLALGFQPLPLTQVRLFMLRERTLRLRWPSYTGQGDDFLLSFLNDRSTRNVKKSAEGIER